VSSERFSPRLTPSEAVGCAARYKAIDDEDALKAGRRIKAGECSRAHLQTIFKWKTKDRGKSRIARNSDAEIEDALRLTILAKEPRSGLAVLTGLYGVDIPVASAIATAIHPDRYTVIDRRALETLGYKGAANMPLYLEYLAYCTALATDWNMSLRTLDRALWQWSSERNPQGSDALG
jgi:hypothetical protein